MPFYQKKCEENTWSVRRVCVDIIIDLVKHAKTSTSKEWLSKWILHFLKDGHKTVRINAHKVLPMFIGMIELPKDSFMIDKLLDPYLRLLDSELDQQVGSNKIVRNIAYTFPAVLKSLGSIKWKQLYPLFNRMMKFTDKDIRIPLACSLH
jgi:serine/threonine-protein phosphatase 4 regulatory subunit 1